MRACVRACAQGLPYEPELFTFQTNFPCRVWVALDPTISDRLKGLLPLWVTERFDMRDEVIPSSNLAQDFFFLYRSKVVYPARSTIAIGSCTLLGATGPCFLVFVQRVHESAEAAGAGAAAAAAAAAGSSSHAPTSAWA